MQFLRGQTLIINEVSNGPSGAQEFVELLVISTTPPEPCAPPPCMDIRGWVIDDNNGYHGGQGIAAGAVRFGQNALWSCVPVGTLITVYNSNEPNASLPPDDLSLTDGNCSLVMGVNSSTYFEHTSTSPQPVPCNDPGGWVPGGSWDGNLAMLNASDCMRLSSPDGCEMLSVCYGADSQNPMIYFAGTGLHHEWYFNDGDPYSQANWVESCTMGCETPGSPNSPANAAYIAALNNNCTPIVPLDVTASATATCSCDGTATADPTGAPGPYTYVWYDASGNPIGQTTATATGLCTGDYQVQVTAASGCTETVDVTVPSLPGPDAGTDGAVGVCPGDGPIDLFTHLGGTPDGGGTWSPALGSGTGVFDVTLDVAGTYTYSVSGPGCPPATADVVVTLGTPPDITLVIDSISCHGVLDGGLNASATTGASPFTYTWDHGLPDGPDQAGLGADTYTVTVTGGDGCSATTSATIIDPTALTVTTSTSTAFCGFANGTACATASGGTGTPAYVWDAGAGSAACLDPATPGAHGLAVSDAHGCNITVAVDVPDSMPTITAEVSDVHCNGGNDGSIQLTVPATPITAFGWTGPDAFTSSNEDISDLTPGDYTYTWTDVNGCSLTGMVTITEPAALQLLVTATPETCFGTCDGALDAALVNGVSPIAFSILPPNWSDGHFAPLCAGTYTVHASDASGCTLTTTVDVPPGPAGANAAILPVDPLCLHDAPILLQAVDGGGTWSGPGIVDPATGLFDPAVAGAGDIVITHTMDGSCNGPGTTHIIVVAPPSPAFDVELQGPEGLEIITVATNHTPDAMAYLWSWDGVFISTDVDLRYSSDAIEVGDHQICLVAVNEQSCSDTLCRTITTADTTDIFVPNSFTPDGDGFNEAFGVVVRGLEPEGGVLQVFDRWGELVFSGEGLSRARWDGMFRGHALPPEVFVWRIHYRDPASRRDVTRVGHVTLLR